MKLKSIFIVGLSAIALARTLPVHAVPSFPDYSDVSVPANASYGVLYYYKGLRVLDLFTNHPGHLASTNTSPTNVQNAEATNISNSTNQSIQTQVVGIYGTERKPQPCPSSRVVPQQGALSVEQAKVYFHCDQETEIVPTRFGQGMLWLVSDLDIKIAPRPRVVNSSDFEYARTERVNLSIDTQQPVYDIKASFIRTVCHSLGSFEPGKRCNSEFYPGSNGICFRDTFGEWHCRAKGSSKPVANP